MKTMWQVIKTVATLTPGAEGRTEHVSLDGHSKWDTREEAESIAARLNTDAAKDAIKCAGRPDVRNHFHVDWIYV